MENDSRLVSTGPKEFCVEDANLVVVDDQLHESNAIQQGVSNESSAQQNDDDEVDVQYYVLVDDEDDSQDVQIIDSTEARENGIRTEIGHGTLTKSKNGRKRTAHDLGRSDRGPHTSKKNSMAPSTSDETDEIYYECGQSVEIPLDCGAEHTVIEMPPKGLKMRRNRQFGNCECPECGASFVNANRLERHLAVHQVYGSFLCPLCGKTFKYEYNLFFHWRRTCHSLDEVIATDERETMDVNMLRSVVDDVVSKKALLQPTDIGISRSMLFRNEPTARLEMPSQYVHSRRGMPCKGCGVLVPSNHMSRHFSVHQSKVMPDMMSPLGGYFCDLCGLLFRHHYNLIRHWRTSCPEIQANLPVTEDLSLDDVQLREMVQKLIRNSVTMPFSQFEEEIGRDIGANGHLDVECELTDRNGERVPWQSAADQTVVFADDFLDDEEKRVALSSSVTRLKWGAGSSRTVQCPDCFRSFANTGRLERHLAGFHSSFGTYYCIMCGNRFKYEYNLLFHYRKSCPYSKAFIDNEVREQLDAHSLRKLIQQLAEKEASMGTIRMQSEAKLMNLKEIVRGRRVVPVKQTPQVVVPSTSTAPAPELLHPRPGVSGATQCPVCGVIFYGQKVVDRHIIAAHNMEPRYAYAIRAADAELENKLVQAESKGDEVLYGDDDYDSPPILDREPPCEQPIDTDGPETELSAEGVAEMGEDQQYEMRTRIIGPSGAPIDGIDSSYVDEVRQMIESGSLSAGDQLVLISNGAEITYQVLDFYEQDGQDFVIVLMPAYEGYELDVEVGTLSPKDVISNVTEIKQDVAVFGDQLLDTDV